MAEDVDAGLAEILTLVLGQPVAPGEDIKRADIAKWDSLKHLEIIFAIEGAYGVAFSADEIGAVESVADLKSKVLTSDAA